MRGSWSGGSIRFKKSCELNTLWYAITIKNGVAVVVVQEVVGDFFLLSLTIFLFVKKMLVLSLS